MTTDPVAGPCVDDGLVSVLRALGEPRRLALVRALRESERCVSDLVTEVGFSQPLVSHHLSKLAEVGLVSTRHADGFTHYALDAAALDAAQRAVGGLLDVENLPAAAWPGGNGSCCR